MQSHVLECYDVENEIVDCESVVESYIKETVILNSLRSCPKYQDRCCIRCSKVKRLDYTTNECKNCPAGHACPTDVNLADKVLCKAGYFSIEGDLRCRACDQGTSCSRNGMSKPGKCPNGSNCDVPANPTLCSAGHKCVDGIMSKCGKGYYSHRGLE